MSLITVENTNTQIEANDLIELTHTSGWNGGSWSYPISKNAHEELRFFFVASEGNGDLVEMIPEKSVESHGIDHDHGHQYTWKRNDVSFRLQCIPSIFSVHINLITMLESGKVYILVK